MGIEDRVRDYIRSITQDDDPLEAPSSMDPQTAQDFEMENVDQLEAREQRARQEAQEEAFREFREEQIRDAREQARQERLEELRKENQSTFDRVREGAGKVRERVSQIEVSAPDIDPAENEPVQFGEVGTDDDVFDPLGSDSVEAGNIELFGPRDESDNDPPRYF